MEQVLQVYAERKLVMKQLLREKSLFPKEMPEEAMHSVESRTEQQPDEGFRLSVERFPVWSNKFANALVREDFGRNGIGNPRRNIELVVPGLVPEKEYIKIKECADDGNYRILNAREFPYYPKALWVKVARIDKLDSIWRQFPEQIILVDIDNNIPYNNYEQILFQAVAKGYIVLNPGPWVENEDSLRDDSLFELELYKKRKEIKELSKQRGYLENFHKRMKWEWNKQVDVLWQLAEEKGRDRARVESMASRKATIQSLDEKIALLHDKLNHYDTMFRHMLSKCHEEAGNIYEEYCFFSFELHEEESIIAKAEAALKGLREQLERMQTDVNYEVGTVRDAIINCSGEDIQDLQEKLQWHGTSLQSLHSNQTEPGLRLRRVIRKRVMRSLLGVSTSLGLSLFAFACLPWADGHYTLSFLRPHLMKNAALLKIFNPIVT